MSIKDNITELNALLEQVNNLPEAGAASLETCTLTFPPSHINETLWYTDGTGRLVEYTRITNEFLTLTVLSNSIVYSNMDVFDGNTYIYDAFEDISNLGSDGHAISVHGSVELQYSDNAPV